MARYPRNQGTYQESGRFQESRRYLENGIRARENRSSAWALLIVGGAGMLCAILGIVGILPIGLGNPYLFYGVMMAVALLFLVMGVLSMKSARIFSERAKVEGTLLETVEKWCMENLTAESVDAALWAEGLDADTVSDVEGPDAMPQEEQSGRKETLYFQRAEYLKEQINSQFMNLDQRLLERFIDEDLYGKIFDSLPGQADGDSDEDHHSLCG